MIPANPCEFNDHHCNVAPAQALILRLKSLKDSLENKFSRESNSHRLLVTIVVIIETEVIFVFIHKIANLRTFLL